MSKESIHLAQTLERLTIAAKLWDGGAPARRAQAWLEGEGRKFLRLPSSQVAALQRAVAASDTPSAFLDSLTKYVEGAAKRGKGDSVWERTGEAQPLKTTLSAVCRAVVEQARLDPGPPNQVFRKCLALLGRADREAGLATQAEPHRDAAVLHQFFAALVKRYRAQSLFKELYERSQ